MYPQGLGQQQDLGWAEIRTIKGAKKRRWVYTVGGQRQAPLLGDRDITIQYFSMAFDASRPTA